MRLQRQPHRLSYGSCSVAAVALPDAITLLVTVVQLENGDSQRLSLILFLFLFLFLFLIPSLCLCFRLSLFLSNLSLAMLENAAKRGDNLSIHWMNR